MQFAHLTLVLQSRRKEISSTDISLDASSAALIMILVKALRRSAMGMHGGSLVFTLKDSEIFIRIPSFK
jgi:hypothetical protein